MMSKNDNSIEALRQILLQDDLIKLQKLEDDLFDLQQTIADKESLIASLDPIIADLLERKIAVSKDEMAEALAPVMGEAIRLQVAEAKDDVIDALYPVIGKIIRKSVAESMKKFIDSVNQKIEQTLRSRLFKKRVQSKLTGIPESQLILKDALPFKIEEIFLIHKESGLLISHVSSQETEVKVNEEMISGMLTAIRDFVSEAFTTKEPGDLNEIQYGESKILLEMGHHSYLALVVSGFQPADFQNDMRNLGRRIHNRFAKVIRQFHGEMTNSGEITKYLSRFFEKYNGGTLQKAPVKSKSYLLYLLLLLSFLAIAFFAIRKIPDYLFERQAKHSIVSDLPAELNQRINARLSRSANLQAAKPRFIFEADQVIIEGEAPDLPTKRDIGFIVSEVTGIRLVINNMMIVKKPQFSLETVRNFLKPLTIYFDVNNASIPDDEIFKLDSLLHYVQNLNDVKLIVKGYSDNSSTPAYNLSLSEQRANEVAEYLKAKNLPARQINVEYFGMENPAASNDTESGRARNRRVEFDVQKER
ncbi:OmpA family protein [candidate division KSB1 bacterium]|nr:OmpA family protein [candidate division KSB1 bacterium]